MIIIALYPGDTVAYIQKYAAAFRKDAVVIDCCGVKRSVYEKALPISRQYGFTFIGGHPMAGIEHFRL